MLKQMVNPSAGALMAIFGCYRDSNGKLQMGRGLNG